MIVSLAALTSSAVLANATANLTPSASITNSCTVTGNPLSFGAYDPIGGAAVTQSATISISCSYEGTAHTMTVFGKIDAGQHSAVAGTYTDTVIITVTF